MSWGSLTRCGRTLLGAFVFGDKDVPFVQHRADISHMRIYISEKKEGRKEVKVTFLLLHFLKPFQLKTFKMPGVIFEGDVS